MYSNKQAKALIERLTPEPLEPWGTKDLPWLKSDCWGMSTLPEAQRDLRILRRLRKTIGEQFYNDVVQYMAESMSTWDYHIVYDCPGEGHQAEDFGLVRDVWIDQSVGYLGDDFYGQIWIKVTNKRYFYFRYSC